MRDWLLGNVCLLALIVIGALVFLVFGSIAALIHPKALYVAAIASLIVTGYMASFLLRWLERWINRAP